MAEPYLPQAMFSPDPSQPVPRVFAAPPKYVQGPGVLRNLGRYLSLSGFTRYAILASPRGHGAEGGAVIESLAGAETIGCTFAGECSLEEIDRHADALPNGDTLGGREGDPVGPGR